MVRGECGAEKKDTHITARNDDIPFSRNSRQTKSQRLSEDDPHKDKHNSYTWACKQLCVLATVCDWFNQYKTSQEAHRRGGLEYATEDRTNLTLREDLNYFGKPNARPRR